MVSEETLNHRKVLGSKIEQLRKIKNITQIELAKALGYSSTGTISQVENGERGMKAEKMALAADFLGVPIQVLLGTSPMDVDDLKMISIMTDMINTRPKERPEKFQKIKDLLLK